MSLMASVSCHWFLLALRTEKRESGGVSEGRGSVGCGSTVESVRFQDNTQVRHTYKASPVEIEAA
jgi:hypothetical protein